MGSSSSCLSSVAPLSLTNSGVDDDNDEGLLEKLARQPSLLSKPVLGFSLLLGGVAPTWVHVACERKQVQLVERIFEFLSRSNGDTVREALGPYCRRTGRPPPLSAAEGLKLLADICNGKGQTPLMQAAYAGCPQLVHFLLDQGANPLAVDRCGCRTALHYAVIGGCVGSVTALLRTAAVRQMHGEGIRYVDMPSQGGMTPLHYAVCYERLVVLQELLRHHPNIAAATTGIGTGGLGGMAGGSNAMWMMDDCDAAATSLHLAAARGNAACSVELLRYYASRQHSSSPLPDPRLARNAAGKQPWQLAVLHHPTMRFLAMVLQPGQLLPRTLGGSVSSSVRGDMLPGPLSVIAATALRRKLQTNLDLIEQSVGCGITTWEMGEAVAAAPSTSLEVETETHTHMPEQPLLVSPRQLAAESIGSGGGGRSSPCPSGTDSSGRKLLASPPFPGGTVGSGSAISICHGDRNGNDGGGGGSVPTTSYLSLSQLRPALLICAHGGELPLSATGQFLISPRSMSASNFMPDTARNRGRVPGLMPGLVQRQCSGAATTAATASNAAAAAASATSLPQSPAVRGGCPGHRRLSAQAPSSPGHLHQGSRGLLLQSGGSLGNIERSGGSGGFVFGRIIGENEGAGNQGRCTGHPFGVQDCGSDGAGAENGVEEGLAAAQAEGEAGRRGNGNTEDNGRDSEAVADADGDAGRPTLCINGGGGSARSGASARCIHRGAITHCEGRLPSGHSQAPSTPRPSPFQRQICSVVTGIGDDRTGCVGVAGCRDADGGSVGSLGGAVSGGSAVRDCWVGGGELGRLDNAGGSCVDTWVGARSLRHSTSKMECTADGAAGHSDALEAVTAEGMALAGRIEISSSFSKGDVAAAVEMVEESGSVCKVCYSRPESVTPVGCCHGLCTSCARELCHGLVSHPLLCPFCRRPVSEFVKIWAASGP